MAESKTALKQNAVNSKISGGVSSFKSWQRARMSMPRNPPRDADNDKEKETPEERNREIRVGLEGGPRAFAQQIIRKVTDDD